MAAERLTRPGFRASCPGGAAFLALALLAPIGMTSCLPDDDGGAAGASGADGAAAAKAPLSEKITIAGTTYTLELARDDAARSKGMGGRKTLAADAGMLFIFPDSQRRSFWMRDCSLDLDIIFVDPLGYVTAVHHMPAEPPRGPEEAETAYLARLKNYSSFSPAQFAIEVHGGELEKLKVKPNDKIDADWKRLKKLAK